MSARRLLRVLGVVGGLAAVGAAMIHLARPLGAAGTHSLVWAEPGRVEAKIRWTDYGVPHIQAGNLEGLGYGFGYAQAADHLCLLASAFVRVNGQRARYFGPDGGTPGDGANVQSDFLSLALQHRTLADERWAGLPEQSRALIQGYAAGYNRYLGALHHGEEPAQHRCGKEEWVRELAPQDVLAYLFALGAFAGADRFAPELWAASRQEPLQGAAGPVAPLAVARLPRPSLGSNAWALGRELTAGGGILLANPHFPHEGPLRFWESHLTVPGLLDVAGASLLGVPGVVNIGFNQNLAWSHTYSTSQHTVVYRIDLAGDGRQYRFGGELRPIEIRGYSILVKDGAQLLPLRRSFRYSHLGPLLEGEALPANSRHAYALFDQNRANADIVEHWLAMNRAKDLPEFQQAFRRYDGTLFNNTLYADHAGNTFYIDDSTVPALPPAAVAAIEQEPALHELAGKIGSVVVPATGPERVAAGPVPYGEAPQLQRPDYVQNANDSHWLANPASPLTGFSPLYGPEQTEQSFRTRLSLTLLGELAKLGRPVALQDVEAALLTDRAYLPALIAPEIRAMCRQYAGKPLKMGRKRWVGIDAPCAVLAKSDLGSSLRSPGAPLWRELAGLLDPAQAFAVPFDQADPVNTPRQLHASKPAAELLARAAANLEAAGWRLDATLGEMQFVKRQGGSGQQRITWPGGDDLSGGFNTFSGGENAYVIGSSNEQDAADVVTGEPLASGLARSGYPINFGSSWMLVVGFGSQGPVARGLMTYSQSSVAGSPHHLDQTQRYAEGAGLRPVPFTETEVSAATRREKTIRPRHWLY